MSKTSDMHIDQTVRDEMAREAGPVLAKALIGLNAVIDAMWNDTHRLAHRETHENAICYWQQKARAALKAAGLEP